MKYAAMKFDTLTYVTVIILVISISQILSCGTTKNLKISGELSQQEAAIVMIGSLSAELLMVEIAPESKKLFLTMPEDISRYFQYARYSKNIYEKFKEMLRNRSNGTLNTQSDEWNKFNSILSDEARRISPKLGQELYNFGISLRMTSMSFNGCDPSTGLSEENLKENMKLAIQGLAAPIGQTLYPTACKLPLPVKMKNELIAAKKISLSDLKACQKFYLHLVNLQKMLRAVALYRENSFDKFKE